MSVNQVCGILRIVLFLFNALQFKDSKTIWIMQKLAEIFENLLSRKLYLTGQNVKGKNILVYMVAATQAHQTEGSGD